MVVECFCGEPCFRYVNTTGTEKEIIWKCNYTLYKMSGKLQCNSREEYGKIVWDEATKKPCNFIAVEPVEGVVKRADTKEHNNIGKSTGYEQAVEIPELEKRKIILKKMKEYIRFTLLYRKIKYFYPLEEYCRKHGFTTYEESSLDIKSWLTELEQVLTELLENDSSIMEHAFKIKESVSFREIFNKNQSKHDINLKNLRGCGDTLPTSIIGDTSRWY